MKITTSRQTVRGLMTEQRPHRTVGRQRKNDESGRREEQRVVQLLLGQHAFDEAVQAGSRGQQDHDDDREARSEHGLADREGAEKDGGEEGDLRRQTGIASSGTRVADGEQSADHHGRRHENDFAAEGEAQPPGQGRDGERADSRRRAPAPEPFRLSRSTPMSRPIPSEIASRIARPSVILQRRREFDARGCDHSPRAARPLSGLRPLSPPRPLMQTNHAPRAKER